MTTPFADDAPVSSEELDSSEEEEDEELDSDVEPLVKVMAGAVPSVFGASVGCASSVLDVSSASSSSSFVLVSCGAGGAVVAPFPVV